MDHSLLNQNNIQKGHTRKKRWRKVLGVLSGIVVSFTTYALILPAITATAPTYCGLEEHTHTDECYELRLICTEAERPAVEAVEADPGHTHSEACYEKVLVCEKEEHVHEELCFSDANDKETREQWEATMPLMELDGIWAEDLLAVAESQLGVGESEKNFILENGARKGYTRFGDWYGIPYGDWCAMYVSYCLHYAGIPTSAVPRDSLTGWACTAPSSI